MRWRNCSVSRPKNCCAPYCGQWMLQKISLHYCSNARNFNVCAVSQHFEQWQLPAISCFLAIQSLTQTRQFVFLCLLSPYSAQATDAIFCHYLQKSGIACRVTSVARDVAACGHVWWKHCCVQSSSVIVNQKSSNYSWNRSYFALLGGSNWMTQSTSGMSTPRAMTSVHTKTPLKQQVNIMSWFQRYSTECSKIETTTKCNGQSQHNNMSQWKLEANACDWRQAREKAGDQVAIAFWFRIWLVE